MNRDRYLVSVALVVLAAGQACRYENRPAPGAMVCGPGAKACPDNYACYRGTVGSNCSNTCWPRGAEPVAGTICGHGGVITDNTDHPDAGADVPVDVPMHADAVDTTTATDVGRDLSGAGGGGGGGGDAGGAPDMGSQLGTPAALSISPTTKDFGTVVAGLFGEASFQISNSGGQPSSVPMVNIDGTDAALFSLSMNTCTGAVPPSMSCTVTVRFSPTPTTTGAKSARLNVSATLGGAVTATLDGMAVPPGALTVTPSTQPFGSLLQGTTGAPVSFTVKNTGGAATGALTTVVQNSTELAIATDGCRAKVLAPAETCIITVTFTPAGPGQKSGTLVVSGTPGGTASASLTGIGLAPALLAIDPVSGSFPTTAVGATAAAQTFKITNSGGVAAGGTSGVAAVVGGTNPGDFVPSSNGCTGTLLPGASCMVTIAFKPAAPGPRSATLTASATPGGSVPAALSGVGVNPALLRVAAATGASVNFGSIVSGSSATQTFTVTNTGGQPSSAITVSASGAGFSVATPGAGDCVSGTTTLAVSASCNVHVVLSSTTAGPATGGITASATAGGTSMLALSGTIVTQGSISINPKTGALGSFLPGVSSAATLFSVTNDGGSTTPALTTSITGTTEFTITADACNTKTLAAGASCSISVVFKPANPGAKTGSLSVSGGVAGVTAAALTGTGLVPATLSLSGAMSFGSVVVGQTSATQSLTLTNTGDVVAGTTTTIASALSGTNASEFAVTGTTCAATLAAKGTCTVSVAFKPTSAGAGKTATLTVSGAPGGAPTATLAGTGLAQASLHLSVGAGFSNEFGSLVVGSSPAQIEQFVVTNTGQQTSSALTITLTGTDFTRLAATGLDCVSAPGTNATTLAPNASCTVRVSFSPTMAVSRTATLSVSATTGGSDSLTTLHGTGVSPSALTVSASTLDLGSVLQGGKSSTPATITVRNTGGVATGAITTSIPAGEFAITSDGCKGLALAPNLTCAVGVTFSPVSASAAVKTSTLTVSASPGGSPTVALSGRGTTLTLDQTSFTFPTTAMGSSSLARSFTVTNPTAGPAGVTTGLSVTVTGAALGDFNVDSTTCSGQLGASGICGIIVSFRPFTFGLRAATLNINANAGGTVSAALSGQGQAPDGQFGCVTDNDCQSACRTFYRDLDADTYGDFSKPVRVCGFTTPNGYAGEFGTPDCDDLDPTMFPFVTRCQSAVIRAYCLDDGIVRTQNCTGGGCRENYCIGTSGIAGSFTCSSGLTCSSAQGCTYTTSPVRPDGAPPACGLQNTGGSVLSCDGGDDCAPGEVCCTDFNCGLTTIRKCFAGSCPPSVQCTPWGQLCDPLAPDCQGGLRCVGGSGDLTSGQGLWSCAP